LKNKPPTKLKPPEEAIQKWVSPMTWYKNEPISEEASDREKVIYPPFSPKWTSPNPYSND